MHTNTQVLIYTPDHRNNAQTIIHVTIWQTRSCIRTNAQWNTHTTHSANAYKRILTLLCIYLTPTDICIIIHGNIRTTNHIWTHTLILRTKLSIDPSVKWAPPHRPDYQLNHTRTRTHRTWECLHARACVRVCVRVRVWFSGYSCVRVGAIDGWLFWYLVRIMSAFVHLYMIMIRYVSMLECVCIYML